MKLSDLQKEAGAQGSKSGFRRSAFGTRIALVHTELSEALEAHRAGNKSTEVWYGDKGKPEGVPSELADVVIRVALICAQEGINLEEAVKEKLAYNRTRTFKHGGKRY